MSSAAIAVLGTGALGSPIGGLLTRAGHDVMLIDQWVAHVEAMKAKGLRITVGLRDDPVERFVVPVRAFHPYEAAALRPEFDIVFITCKSYDTQWLTQFIKPYIKEDGVIVSVQNSLNNEWIAPIMGAGRDLGCVLTAGGGELLAPGDTWRDHPKNHYVLGELDGRTTPRLSKVCEILGDAATISTSTNIWGAKWTKLVKTAMAAPLAGITGKRTRELFLDDRCRAVAAQLAVETIKVGLALGYKMEPIVPDLTTEELIANPDALLGKGEKALVPGKEAPNFISQDLAKGRRTEIDYINGLVCRKGEQAGIPTPMNQRAVGVIHRMERNEMRPDPANVGLMET